MAEFYVVYIRRLPTVTAEAVQAKMDLARSWYRITERIWVLHTTANAEKLYARFGPLVRDSGSLFISKLDISDYQGWMNQAFWDWLNKRQEAG